MDLRDFQYVLPSERIAQRPPARREDARLMVLGRSGAPQHRRFPDLLEHLRPGDLLVLNDTRVVPARLILHRTTGGKVEALLVRRVAERKWEALLKTSRTLSVGERLDIDAGRRCFLKEKTADGWVLEFDAAIDGDLERMGRAPLPPYIKRAEGPDDEDRARYQTVYARNPGAIAAPTAGLHFTPELLDRVRSLGVATASLTLHVGTGTFKPVKAERIEDHRVDPERFEIPEATAQAVEETRRRGGRVVAVGTTSCRTLESWARTGERSGWTDLFIHPPFEFRAVDALLTNFHVPGSSLLMLACAFSGRERILTAYEEAVREGYRFFSYGDATLLI